jgi:hypothetical protein
VPQSVRSDKDGSGESGVVHASASYQNVDAGTVDGDEAGVLARYRWVKASLHLAAVAMSQGDTDF